MAVISNSSHMTNQIMDNFIEKHDHLIHHDKRKSLLSNYIDNINDTIENTIESNIFLNYDYCYTCCKSKKIKKLYIEDIIGGFGRDTSSDYSICFNCLNNFHPKIYLISDAQKSVDKIETIKLLNPIVLLREIDNMIRLYGEKYFFLSNYHINRDQRYIFWNIVYYFNLLKLPCFVLYVNKNKTKNHKVVEELEKIRQVNKSNKTNSVYDTKSIFSGGSEKDSTSGNLNNNLYINNIILI